MEQLGIGAMLHILGGGSENDPAKYVGLTVAGAVIQDNRLRMVLGHHPTTKVIEIWDDGQSCCESRYMATDDDLETIVGGKLLHIIAKDGPEIADDGDCHETVFVEVATDKGLVTVVNHHEHNGYYGGFGLTITELD